MGRERARARAPRARRRRVAGAGAYRRAAQQRLARFRQGSLLAVAITGLALLLFGEPTPAQDSANATPAAPATAAAQDLTDTAATQVGRAVDEATGTLRQLAVEFSGLLPKILIALAILALAALAARLAKPVLRGVLRAWERAEAWSALSVILIWLVALGIALSVVAGDVRALVGSLGLFGLALSWALQAPIESFTAWLLNSLRGYYRVGDRIAVGDVFGDVARIDFLTTTVWEAGGANKPVQGAQPTGALTTFPNSELLRNTIVNYTRDFPYVWDEVVVGVANESEIEYAMRVVAGVAREVVGPGMKTPVQTYREMLDAARLAFDVSEEPQVYLSLADAWTDITVRYLVPARERRRWASALTLALANETAKPEHRGRIIPSYPVTRVERHEGWLHLQQKPGEGADDVDGNA